jgi:hypothetical protein
MMTSGDLRQVRFYRYPYRQLCLSDPAHLAPLLSLLVELLSLKRAQLGRCE